MPYANDKRLFAIIFILVPFVLAFAMAYYNSANSVVKPYEIFKKKFYNQNPLHRYQSAPSIIPIPADQVILNRNEKFFINGTCLVYKGLDQGVVSLDLYLLEFDPDQPYPMRLTTSSFDEGIWLGDSLYKLVTVKKKTLRLRVQASN